MKRVPLFTPLLIFIPYATLLIKKSNNELSKFLWEILGGYMFIITVIFLIVYDQFEISFGREFIHGFTVKKMLIEHETERGTLKSYDNVSIYPSELLATIFFYVRLLWAAITLFVCYQVLKMKADVN